MFLCVDISKVQDDVVGDGTTSVVVLAAELLRVSFIILIGIDVMKVYVYPNLFCDLQNNIARKLYE